MPTTAVSEIYSNLTWAVTGAVAAAGLIGLVMLLWGRVLHRALLVLIAAGIGLAAGGVYGPRIGLDVFVARLVAAISFGILGLVLARLVWALLAGLHVAALVAGLMMVFYLQVQLPTSRPASEQEFAAWQAATKQAIEAALQEGGPVVAVAAVLAGLVVAVTGFLLPAATRIVMTALLGAQLLAAAGVWAALLWAPQWAAEIEAEENRPIVLGAVGGVLAVGLLFQTVGEIRARRARREQPAPAEPAGRKPKGGK